ncbi:CoA transferase subunit A [Desulfoluna spongiiphila]|uniref:Acetate CoA/acetoacetate CoA-transferase alpha subunit n=1 Tax=Desulfoluna spongiiphila TaxID=419481 RepID=A0A1G5HQ74_9BACT|nr:CoA transferase subunit A [Desulfoluna spongiiphila]SCY65923.1 acetate CoA/acetoacetate CoA-transferase alpha subunit [Desulfoluna spongiiphila]VVS95715.1 3-oxoacid coa-transferase subunit a [Desulfoluna spongiiphila]
MNKITTMKDAVARIESGMTVMIGGFMTVGTPEALVDAVVEKGVTDLTVVCNDAGVPGKGAGKLIRNDMASCFYASHVGLNPEFGKLMSENKIDAVLVPQGTLAERIRAAGVGLGGILTPTGVGTHVEEGKEKLTVDGREFLLEPPIKGDVALIKAFRADRQGNLVFRKSAQNFNPLMAMACDYVIVEAEYLEDVGAIDPDHVMLPGIFVDAVVGG